MWYIILFVPQISVTLYSFVWYWPFAFIVKLICGWFSFIDIVNALSSWLQMHELQRLALSPTET